MRQRLLRACALLLPLAAVAAGCGAAASPRTLFDGTPAGVRPTALRHIDGRAVLGRVQIRRAWRLPRREQACLRSFRSEFRVPPSTVVVERSGVLGGSLTFRDAQGRAILGCDVTAAPDSGGRLAGRPWCARSVGRLFGGRLRDARVGISCTDLGGSRVSFAWVNALPQTRWIVSESDHEDEIFEVVAGFPTRITGREVDDETSSAGFAVVEIRADGTEVRRYGFRAGVAG